MIIISIIIYFTNNNNNIKKRAAKKYNVVLSAHSLGNAHFISSSHRVAKRILLICEGQVIV